MWVIFRRGGGNSIPGDNPWGLQGTVGTCQGLPGAAAATWSLGHPKIGLQDLTFPGENAVWDEQDMDSPPPSPAVSRCMEQGCAGFGKMPCPAVAELWMDQHDLGTLNVTPERCCGTRSLPWVHPEGRWSHGRVLLPSLRDPSTPGQAAPPGFPMEEPQRGTFLGRGCGGWTWLIQVTPTRRPR